MKLFDIMHLMESFNFFESIIIYPKDDSGKKTLVKFTIWDNEDISFVVIDDIGIKSGSLSNDKLHPKEYDNIRDMEINLNSIASKEKSNLIEVAFR